MTTSPALDVEKFSAEQAAAYERFVSGLGFVELPERTCVELTGAERAAFFHNYCTNHIKRLTPGKGCETFLTVVTGKILSHGLTFCRSDSLVFDTVAGQAGAIISHLNHFRLRTKVEFRDRSQAFRQLLFASPAAAVELSRRCLADPAAPFPNSPLEHTVARLGDTEVEVRRVPFVGPHGVAIVCPADQFSSIRDALTGSGFGEVPAAVFDARRIECGWPEFGRDVTADNFPHEVNRVASSVSFVKGCYLGQETVARMDSVGHANWLLMGLRFSGETLPAEALALEQDGKVVARLLSRSWSPRHQGVLAMAYVRHGMAKSGQRFASPWGDAELVEFTDENGRPGSTFPVGVGSA